MVKSNKLSNLSVGKRVRVELIDLKLFITRPSLFYKSPKVQKTIPTNKKTTTKKISLKKKSVKKESIKKTTNKITNKKSIKKIKVSNSTATNQTATTNTPIVQQCNNVVYNLCIDNYITGGTAFWSLGAAVLTIDSTDRIGSVFSNNLLDIEKSFTVEFSYTMETNGTDGLSFIIHNSQSQHPFEFYRLLEGGLLGYNTQAEGGILAVEFKTVLTDDIEQPDSNCITIKSSVESVNSLTNTVLSFSSNIINFNKTNNVRLSYDSVSLSISIDLNNQRLLSNIALPAKLAHKGYMGFTAATGYCIQKQQINNCKITILN
ncbi:hypothetical protein DICPUDRAFT_80775 [Dictyostelium purpureum]|uniref:Legume lectin domain-containing protein n=1 Tax=Dictyostelium purpureum TaxID=5786 RepID=F0ZRH9_DICPU|nr:uncharacterized protein DICPUDRAFT_80775 [Dictyostelium purpureum]EGC33458.1 hypothetical protein DICPUDRAFT_80775 [Dictyostelium purpureum]|eukprot:XP_003290029.1 hypothetical protein DICPUDRAFT_80775 [Dictyostelium purpureum]